MTLAKFIKYYSIKPADAIIMQKKIFGMVDHYVIYVGIKNGEHTFIANYNKGVQIIPKKDFVSFLNRLVPIKIDRFPGNENERRIALKRAINEIGKNTYDYLTNNCEHFKNWIHYGIKRSLQVENISKTIFVSTGIIAGMILLSKLFGSD